MTLLITFSDFVANKRDLILLAASRSERRSYQGDLATFFVL